MSKHSDNGTLIETDWSSFDPWRITATSHHLADHPLLQLDALVELGKRLEPKGQVRTHSKQATAGTPFNHAPKLHPNAKGAAVTLSDIERSDAWMSLLNVQSDPQYRALIDSVLDSVRPQIERIDHGMCYRAGWIFVSSPGAVTPFHFDVEHNLLMQIRGRKTVYVWDHTDTVVASELARDQFFAYHTRDRLVWRDEFKQRAHRFELQPGMGAYMPSTSPHMVENGDGPSITMSFTFYTDSTRRIAAIHRAREQLRKRGVKLPPVGAHPILDSGLCTAYRAYASTKRTLRRVAGHQVLVDNAPYAYAQRP